MRRAIGFLYGLGAGAVLMYLLDPARGRKRRGLARDKLAATLRDGEVALDKWMSDAGHRVLGAVAELRQRLRNEGRVDDDVVVARVRAAMGHVVDHPHRIEVSSKDGVVTLRGQAEAREVEGLIRRVSSVRGVVRVTHELRVQGMNGAAAGNHRA